MRHYDVCPFISPDCFKCPFHDCIATQKDIAYQEAHEKELDRIERNKKIKKMYDEGRSRRAISEVMGVTLSTVSHIINYGH